MGHMFHSGMSSHKHRIRVRAGAKVQSKRSFTKVMVRIGIRAGFGIRVV